jgi:hypothetical protein
VRPERGLELFLSATQHVDANRAGLDVAIEAIAATFRAHLPDAPPAPTRRRGRRRPTALVAGLGVLAFVLVLAPFWWPRPIDPEPAAPTVEPAADQPADEPHQAGSDPTVRADTPVDVPVEVTPAEPAVDTATAAARAVMAAAHAGDPERLRHLFTRQAEATYSETQWSALAANARAFFDGATAAEAPFIVDVPWPRRAALLGPGTYALLMSERPFDGGHVCEQVVLRQEAPELWAATSYQYWKAADGRCPGESDLQAATDRAHTLLAALQATGMLAASDLAVTMQTVSGTAEWKQYLENLQTMLAGWSSREHVVAAGPLPGTLPPANGPGIPGRFVSVRFAVDSGGMQRNLDLALQHEPDGEWRLAGIFIYPWQP